MGQDKILQILKKSGKWTPSNEIYKKAKTSRSSMNNSLRKLYEQGLIKRKECKELHSKYEWRYYKICRGGVGMKFAEVVDSVESLKDFMKVNKIIPNEIIVVWDEKINEIENAN